MTLVTCCFNWVLGASFISFCRKLSQHFHPHVIVASLPKQTVFGHGFELAIPVMYHSIRSYNFFLIDLILVMLLANYLAVHHIVQLWCLCSSIQIWPCLCCAVFCCQYKDTSCKNTFFIWYTSASPFATDPPYTKGCFIEQNESWQTCLRKICLDLLPLEEVGMGFFVLHTCFSFGFALSLEMFLSDGIQCKILSKLRAIEKCREVLQCFQCSCQVGSLMRV